jgi:hypothetical protein
MTLEKEQFLADLQEKVRARVDQKFRKGDAEHQSDLMDIDVLEEAFDELIDGLTYAYAAMLKLKNEYARGFKDATLLDK